MALKIRLRQQGSNNRPFFRVVVANVRSPRDGKYVESLGWYNPLEAEQSKNLSVKQDRIQHWLNMGAEVSECCKILIGKAAPDIMRGHTAKERARRAKAAAKRKAKKTTAPKAKPAATKKPAKAKAKVTK